MIRPATARRVAMAWVRLYTAGLPAQARDERRAEIASDTWDELAAAAPRVVASVLLRCLLGIPADLSWRIEQARPFSRLALVATGVLQRVEAAARWTAGTGIPAVAWILGGLYGALGLLLIVLAPFSGSDAPNVALVGGLALLAGVLIVQGRRLISRRRKLACALVCIGAVPPALVLAVTVVVPLVTLVAIADTVRFARRPRAATQAG